MRPRNLLCWQVLFFLLFMVHMLSPRNLLCWQVLFFLLFILRCKTLCIAISFLLFWSIYWSSSLVHFKNGPEYLTRCWEPECLFLSWNSCDRVWFWEVISLIWKLFFKFFPHLHLFEGVYFDYSEVLVNFLFSERFDFSWFRTSILLFVFHVL